MYFKEYNGEPKLNPPISHPEMKTKHPIEIIDPRLHPDYITPKKSQLFQKNGLDSNNSRLFLILTGHREIELI